MTRWRRRKTSCTHPDSSVSSFMLSFWVCGGNQEEEEGINNQPSAQKCVVLFGRNCPSPVPSPRGEEVRDQAHEDRYGPYVGGLPGALFWHVAQKHLTCPFSPQSYVDG